MTMTNTETTAAEARNGRSNRQGDTPAAFITMISESELSLLRTCAAAMTSAMGAIIITKSGTIIPVMPTKTSSVCRWLVIRSKSRIACVNQITTVRLTRVIRNAPMVARNMYRLIDPIGLNIPLPAHAIAAFATAQQVPAADLPRRQVISCVHKMAPPRQSY
jgi:hypothetical protein